MNRLNFFRVAWRLALYFSLLLVSFNALNIMHAGAFTDCTIESLINNTQFYDPCAVPVSCQDSTTGDVPNVSQESNRDYAGRPILTDGQLLAIQQNQPFYQKAAQQYDIPWQLIAVIHLQEHGLARSNPSNGQGVYQFLDKHGGPYPTGLVSDEEFQRQTNLAAQFLKGKAASNYSPNRTLTASSGPEVIKDTLFSYNGRAPQYIKQAQSLGFVGANQGYEGSPYVMTKADAKRDPDVNTTGWGQVKHDNGPIEYPANDRYGAFVVYASLANISTTGSSTANNGSCNGSGINGPARQKIVQIAQQELKLWKDGTLKPGSGYLKYSHGFHEDWCAFFVSWVYNQAGVPLPSSASEGSVGGVDEVKQLGVKSGHYHERAGYTPQVGDIVIRTSNNEAHVNIVISVNPTAKTMEVIGGNQAGSNGPDTSVVTQYTDNWQSDPGITGYVSPE